MWRSSLLLKQNKAANDAMARLTGLLLVFLLTGCTKSKQPEQPVITQLNELITKTEVACEQPLLKVGNDLIGEKTHYLQLLNVPLFTESASESESTETTEQTQKDKESTQPANVLNHKQHAVITGVLQYNDRLSHLRFDSYYLQANKDAVGASDASCVVSYQLNYQLDIPCIEAREAFKRWRQVGEIGDFGEKTRYFMHQRKPSKKAYLTSISRDTQCLVSVQDVQGFPL